MLCDPVDAHCLLVQEAAHTGLATKCSVSLKTGFALVTRKQGLGDVRLRHDVDRWI
jgi:hypothetical protein